MKHPQRGLPETRPAKAARPPSEARAARSCRRLSSLAKRTSFPRGGLELQLRCVLILRREMAPGTAEPFASFIPAARLSAAPFPPLGLCAHVGACGGFFQ